MGLAFTETRIENQAQSCKLAYLKKYKQLVIVIKAQSDQNWETLTELAFWPYTYESHLHPDNLAAFSAWFPQPSMHNKSLSHL